MIHSGVVQPDPAPSAPQTAVMVQTAGSPYEGPTQAEMEAAAKEQGLEFVPLGEGDWDKEAEEGARRMRAEDDARLAAATHGNVIDVPPAPKGASR